MQSDIENSKQIWLMNTIIVNFWVIANGFPSLLLSSCVRVNFLFVFPCYQISKPSSFPALGRQQGDNTLFCNSLPLLTPLPVSSPLCGLCQVGRHQCHPEKSHLCCMEDSSGTPLHLVYFLARL